MAALVQRGFILPHLAMCLKQVRVILRKQYCGVTWPDLGALFQVLRVLAIQNRSVNHPGTVCEGMIGGDFAPIDGQPQRSGADTEVVGSISQVDPESFFVRLITGNAIMASQGCDSLARPTIAASCEMTIPV